MAGYKIVLIGPQEADNTKRNYADAIVGSTRPVSDTPLSTVETKIISVKAGEYETTAELTLCPGQSFPDVVHSHLADADAIVIVGSAENQASIDTWAEKVTEQTLPKLKSLSFLVTDINKVTNEKKMLLENSMVNLGDKLNIETNSFHAEDSKIPKTACLKTFEFIMEDILEKDASKMVPVPNREKSSEETYYPTAPKQPSPTNYLSRSKIARYTLFIITGCTIGLLSAVGVIPAIAGLSATTSLVLTTVPSFLLITFGVIGMTRHIRHARRMNKVEKLFEEELPENEPSQDLNEPADDMYRNKATAEKPTPIKLNRNEVRTNIDPESQSGETPK